MIKVSKKDLEALAFHKVEAKGPPEKRISLNGHETSDNYPYVVAMALTKGELLALKHALEGYGEVSPVGRTLSAYLEHALFVSGCVNL